MARLLYNREGRPIERASYNGSIEASQASDVGSIPIARSITHKNSWAHPYFNNSRFVRTLPGTGFGTDIPCRDGVVLMPGARTKTARKASRHRRVRCKVPWSSGSSAGQREVHFQDTSGIALRYEWEPGSPALEMPLLWR